VTGLLVVNKIERFSEVRLHIGAHKTATTHIQDVLEKNATLLKSNDVLYLPRSFMRSSGLSAAVRDNYWEVQSQDRLTNIADLISSSNSLPRRILISDEDMLGMSIDILRGLYTNISLRMKPWECKTTGCRTTVFLSIRDYANLLPSAYAQAMRDGALVSSFETYLDFWNSVAPSWSSVVGELKTVFPAADIKVWTFEHYVTHARQITAMLADIESPLVDAPIPHETKRLSMSAVQAIANLDRRLSLGSRRQRVSEIVASDTSGDAYDPLGATDRSALSARYQTELAQIAAMDVDFIG
jgi:hypothetical protein